jgi:hypothetical protein
MPPSRPHGSVPAVSARTRTTESGWPVFAGVLFVLAGIFHVMWGIAGITNDDNLTSSGLLFGGLALWGVIYLVLGLLQLAAAWLIAQAKRAGQALGIALAALSAVNAMFTFAAYPLWSATILIVDLLVIYGLSVHGHDYA